MRLAIHIMLYDINMQYISGDNVLLYGERKPEKCVLLCNALNSRYQRDRPDLEKMSQTSSTAYYRIQFLFLAVIAIYSTLAYPLLISVNNKIKIIKRSNVQDNCYTVQEDEGQQHAETGRRRSQHQLAVSHSSSFLYFVQIFLNRTYKHSKIHIVRKRS